MSITVTTEKQFESDIEAFSYQSRADITSNESGTYTYEMSQNLSMVAEAPISCGEGEKGM